MIETALQVVKYGLKIYSDKIEKEWSKKFEESERVILEQTRLEPEDRDMRKFDEAKKEIYLLEKKIAILMQQHAVKEGLL